MSKQASEFQEKAMSRLYRGKEIFKPLNTGRIDGRVSCVREFIANIFFYTKNGVTVMIDAGYNYSRLKEKMGWLDLEPSSIRHILITHQDTDHVGAVEADSPGLFRDAMLYIGEIENRYLTGEKRRKVYHGFYKLPQVHIDNPKTMLKDGQIFHIGDIKIECFLVPGHTWGHMVYLIDDAYLFTGDTLWFGADGGYSFINVLAEDNALAVRSLAGLENKLRSRSRSIKIITGHTGWTDDMDFAFAHSDKLCNAWYRQKPHDPNAPYDGYDESEDTEEKARSVRLQKQNEQGRCAEIMDLHLGSIQETALIPLAVRANETTRRNARIHDRKAVEVIDALGIDIKDFDKFFSHEGVVARTILFDKTVKRLLKKYPDAVCINLGCGLDDRFSRVDNGKVRWYSIDLPDSIEVRRKFFAETEREHMLAADILGGDWTGPIPKGRVTIVIAEGLLMYFSKEQVGTLLNSITGTFERGFLLAELMHPKMMKEKIHDTVKHTDAKFGWGTVTGEELLELDDKLRLVRENSFWDEMKKYTLVGKIGSIFAKGLNNRLAVYKWQQYSAESGGKQI